MTKTSTSFKQYRNFNYTLCMYNTNNKYLQWEDEYHVLYNNYLSSPHCAMCIYRYTCSYITHVYCLKMPWSIFLFSFLLLFRNTAAKPTMMVKSFPGHLYDWPHMCYTYTTWAFTYLYLQFIHVRWISSCSQNAQECGHMSSHIGIWWYYFSGTPNQKDFSQ